MKPLRQQIITLAVSASLLLGPGAVALTFDLESGNGFVSRGDINSHPDLGKAALALIDRTTNPASIQFSFNRGGMHYEQTCLKSHRGTSQIKVFRQGMGSLSFSPEFRQNRGNLNFTGYTLTGIDNPNQGAPLTLCPNQWLPHEGSVVTLVEGRTQTSVYVWVDSLQGTWNYNPDGTWTAVK